MSWYATNLSIKRCGVFWKIRTRCLLGDVESRAQLAQASCSPVAVAAMVTAWGLGAS
jgi:hypothetical protein